MLRNSSPYAPSSERRTTVAISSSAMSMMRTTNTRMQFQMARATNSRSRKAPSRFDAEAIISDFETLQREVARLREKSEPEDADRLLSNFDRQQIFRAARASRRASGVSESDSDDGRLFLLCIGLQLGKRLPLPIEVATFLSEALVSTAIDPTRVLHAFGLAQAKHRPRLTDDRDYAIAFRVLELSADLPINPSPRGRSALEIAAEEHRVSVDVAERAWKKRRAFAKSWQAALSAANRERGRST
jgi:hypothetical protein